MEEDNVISRPHTVPVCERCRRRRQKCETAELAPCSSCVSAGEECLIAGSDGRTSLPRLYVRGLEERAQQLRQQVREARRQQRLVGLSPQEASETQLAAAAAVSPDFAVGSPTSASESLILNLFSHAPRTKSGEQVKSLVQDLGHVSLSALTEPGPGQTQTGGVLWSLVKSMATLPLADGRPSELNALGLPDQPIAQRVCARYCQDVLPALPFTTPSAMRAHLEVTYGGGTTSSTTVGTDSTDGTDSTTAYSTFVIATVLATTAVFLSPESAPNAAGLYRTGLAHLDRWFSEPAGSPGSSGSSEPSGGAADMLDHLEAVLVLAQFATTTRDRYADGWALSGLAVRIAVDLGLHKVCDSDRKRRLFWSAYALDRRRAAAAGLPVAVSDCAIDADLPAAPPSLRHVFALYRLLSDCCAAKHAANAVWLAATRQRLYQWNQDYRARHELPCRLLEAEYQFAAAQAEAV